MRDPDRFADILNTVVTQVTDQQKQIQELCGFISRVEARVQELKQRLAILIITLRNLEVLDGDI